MRLSRSGKMVHIAYADQALESLVDGLVRVFEVFGGRDQEDSVRAT
jgi:hypothetical protein